MAKGGGKKSKNSGGANNQKGGSTPKCTCDHPFNCQCGNRPPRPSRGHKWDPETQQWGGKGHKQKGGSGQTQVVGQKAQETAVGGTQVAQWQRLPSVLLKEFCQKQKRPPPKFKELKDGKVRCIVPDGKDPDKDLILIPAQAVPNPEQAKEESALLALLHLTPTIPHERKLPEPYRTTWLTAVESIKNKNNNKDSKPKSSNNNKSSNNSSDSGGGGNGGKLNNSSSSSKATHNTNLILGTSHVSTADRKRQQQQKRQKINAKIKKHEAIRMANRDHPVFLSAKLRQQIQRLLKDGDYTSPETDDDDDDDDDNTLQTYSSNRQVYVEKRLHQEGFTKRQARMSFEKISNNNNNKKQDNDDDEDEEQWDQLYDDCLQWLCIHLNEDQLPEGFDPRSETLEVVGGGGGGGKPGGKGRDNDAGQKPQTGTKKLSQHGQTIMKKYGLTLEDTSWLLEQQQKQQQSNGNEEKVLWKHLCQLAEFTDQSSSPDDDDTEANQQALEEEMEALDAIFSSDCSITTTDGKNNISTIVINTPEQMTLTITIGTGQYPSMFPQQVLVSGNWSSNSIGGIGFHVELIKFIKDLTKGEPMIFDIYGQMQQLLQTPEDIPTVALAPTTSTSSSAASGKTVSTMSAVEVAGSQEKSQSTLKRTIPPSSRKGDVIKMQKRPRQRNIFWSKSPKTTPAAVAFNKNVNKTIQSQRISLPASTARSDFITILRNAEQSSRVVLVTGDTGCGKTTQIPQFILEEAPASSKIVVAQPRRIAATGVAGRVAQERGESQPGISSVGYVVRGDSAISSNTRLLFCTFGILLRQLQCEGALDCVTHIIIDEVHERNLDGDVLMALLKDALTTTKHLTVILMSATLDADRFASYWGNNTPRMHIPGRTFPVEDYMLEDVLDLTAYNPPKKRKANRGFGNQGGQQRPRKSSPWDDSELSDGENDIEKEEGEEGNTISKKEPSIQSAQAHANQVPMEERIRRVEQVNVDYDLLGKLVKHLVEKKIMGDGGSILVFLAGAPEINQAKTVIAKICGSLRIRLLPLHGGLQAKEQNVVFLPSPNAVKVVLSTNVAETSITIPDCTVVIDTCREKQSSYDPANRMPLLVEQFASKASLKQRRGRAGRVQRGKCYKLISKSTFDRLKDHSAPEITRVALEQTLLSLLFLGVERGNGRFLRTLLDPPGKDSVDAAVHSLDKVGAIQRLQANGLCLTPLGMHLAGIPAPPVIGKMLVMGCILGCRTAALAMAAVMSSGRSPLLRVDIPRSGGKGNGEETPEQTKQRNIIAERAKIFEEVGNSDHVLLAALFMNWQNLPTGGGQRKKYLERLGLSFTGMRDILQLVNQFDSSLCTAGFTATTESERNRHSWRILRTCSVSALAPSHLVRVQRPSTKYTETSEGAREKDGAAKEFKFFIRRGENESASPQSEKYNDERVFIHPSSALFTVGNYSCPWLVYHSLVKTSKAFLRDATECSAYALLLFGGNLEVEARNNSIVVDKWVKLSANARIGALIRELRRRMDDLFEAKIKDPSKNISNTPEMGLIAKLLATDGLGA